jgi:hypothetical protein
MSSVRAARADLRQQDSASPPGRDGLTGRCQPVLDGQSRGKSALQSYLLELRATSRALVLKMLLESLLENVIAAIVTLRAKE